MAAIELRGAPDAPDLPTPRADEIAPHVAEVARHADDIDGLGRAVPVSVEVAHLEAKTISSCSDWCGDSAKTRFVAGAIA